MSTDFQGYVVYTSSGEKDLPIGVVSIGFECNALSNYIPSKFKAFLVEIEDKRFYEHRGVDFKGIVRASIENIKAGKIIQGGSSITQQLARNILRDNRKTFRRKFRETINAFKLESKYSKDEILDLYFNYVYFGKNLRGLRTAGLCYFHKEVDKLTHIEFISLLTILRGPNFYINNLMSTKSRFQLINKRLLERKLISKNRYQKNLKARLNFENNPLQVISSKTIPFIIKKEKIKQKIIYSTINKEVQVFVRNFILKSKYPVSVIAIKNKNVVAFASSYGSDYPFIAKSNVGSTLKPFLYCYLRENGISKTDTFNGYYNNLNWQVREVNYRKKELTLEESLFYSNNNAFINACHYNNNIESSLVFLAKIFGKDKKDFFPSSILGATKNGISLYELASAYANFFSLSGLSDIKRECLLILSKIARDKLGYNIKNTFLKTGTTNDNKERFAVLGNADITFAILRNENPINDKSKEGNLMR